MVELRHKLDLSQNELGLLLDVSGATVGIWERRPSVTGLRSASFDTEWSGPDS